MSNQPPYHVDQQAIHAAQIAKRGKHYVQSQPAMGICLFFGTFCAGGIVLFALWLIGYFFGR